MESDFLKLKSLRPFRLGDSLLENSLKRLTAITKNLPPPGAIPSSELEKVRCRLVYDIVRTPIDFSERVQQYCVAT